MDWLSRLSEELGGRKVVPLDPPGRKSTEHIVEADDVTPAGEPDEASAWSAFITYTSAEGEETSRVITLRRISGSFGAPELIGAHCHKRDCYRTFRVDRISSMACAVTGEELDPVEHCIALHRNGALKIEDKVLTRVMRIMTFMARCDGEFHALERDALEDTLGRYFRFFGGDDESYECAIREAPRLAPSSADVLKALNFLKRAPQRQELARFVLNSAGAMVDADGRHTSEELLWATELSSALKRLVNA
ncbi:hypothetical protein [uncultured Croceicoccus sp.]|uniref:tellurite resistance TerB family protein n=1 Tax=uncultured Croceicoccus sp. TaxID=1295329 RepID=UPI00262A5267|nr:hypothetical protein [uncultured Croceicoccus sp.]